MNFRVFVNRHQRSEQFIATKISCFMYPQRSLKKRRVFLLFLHVFFPVLLFAQNRISGRVIGENNQPVSDVSIQIKGSNQGVISDGDGKFSLVTKPNDILVISHIDRKSTRLNSS